MNLTCKRALSTAVAVAVAGSTALLVTAPTAFAAGILTGPATVRTAGGGADLNTGNSDTAFTLRLPAGAACPGDSPNDGWRWQTYMVPASVDPSTLTFGSTGPLPAAVGASFRQPLFTTTADPVVNQQTPAADTPGGPGLIINIPDTNYAVFSPGDIPAGAYNIGIACTLGPASATQMSRFWNVQKTFATSAAGGTAQVNWSVGAVPSAPVLSSVTPGDGSLTANYTHTASTPPSTSFTVTATPTGGGAPVTASSASATATTVTGLTNGTSYNVTVRATNTAGNSPESNTLTGTPAIAPRPPVTNLTAAPGTGRVDLSWTAPTGTAPTGYTVTVSPPAGTTSVSGTTAAITGLTAGTLYNFTVTPTHPAPFVGTPASVQATPLSAQVVVDNITVTRPVGALVLTQICGKYGALAADPASTGFPTGLPAATAAGPGTAPTLTGGAPDPKFIEYPYPENPDGTAAPNYPTNCGIDLGVAKFVKTGPGAGQFFSTSGRLNQLTVAETRDSDSGWTINGQMSLFTVTGTSKQFSGSQLGWIPVKTSDTPSFTDSNGTTYDQSVASGAVVQPNTANASGLSSGRTLGSAVAGSGLGIAELDARLKLLIPVFAQSGNYVATLTVTSV